MPQNAKACDKNLTRLPRRIGRHGLYDVVQVKHRGKLALRYIRRESLSGES